MLRAIADRQGGPAEAPAVRLTVPSDALELEAEAAHALREGDLQRGFRLADRRCRTKPWPKPYHYVMRAEALDRLGMRDLALADCFQALALAPDDIHANRRMMRWATGEDQIAAATVLALRDHDIEVCCNALDVLDAAGRRRLARLDILDSRIHGWAAWDSHEPVEVRVSDGLSSMAWRLPPEAASPLRGRGSYACFDWSRPTSEHVQTITVALGDAVLAKVRAAPTRSTPMPRLSGSTRHETGVTVVIPVYADFEATRLCLDSVGRAVDPAGQHRVLVVEDACPDRRITQYLSALAAEGAIKLLVNPANLGFVGSVNRALAQISTGDVVLLNADTIVPRGFLDRLAIAARSADDIGTVTPFSNNGEFLSFPSPNRSNPLPSQEELDALDAAASDRNAGLIVDLPSGIGYCLYITRACLEAVGFLSEDYHRGYLEDVDFCLRAQERGLRNVGAASVFVGHAGSRSFAQDKRSLVVRNLDVLERRFPAHRADCAAFIAADPLRPARERIERALTPSGEIRRLLVAPAGPISTIARARAKHLTEAALPAICLDISPGSRGCMVDLASPTGSVPQSLRFDLANDDDRGAFEHYLGAFRACRVELFDATRLPDDVVGAILRSGLPFDHFVAEPGVISLFPVVNGVRPLHGPSGGETVSRREDGLQLALRDRAEQVLVPDEAAAALLQGRRIGQTIVHLAAPHPPSALQEDGCREPRAVGIVPVFQTPREAALIGDLTEALRSRQPDLEILVLGATAADDRLMRSHPLFVTGAIDDADLPQAVRAHGVGHLVLLLDQPLFGHPAFASLRRCGPPLAFVDWSFGRVVPPAGDLAIDPRRTLDATADAIDDWLDIAQPLSRDALGREPLARYAARC